MNQKTSTLNLRSDNRPLNLDALRSFVAICEGGSFRVAAQHVGRSPSAVSLQIAGLEDRVGERVLIRDARHVELTEAGETLLGYARRMLALSEEAMARTRRTSLSGKLQLVAPFDLGSDFVPRLLAALAARHPDVVVDVRLATTDAVVAAFRAGDASVALFNEVGQTPVSAREIFSEPLEWLQGGAGLAAARDPLPLAMATMRCAWRAAASKALDRANRTYRVAYASDTSAGQVAALQADLAIAALPRSMCAAGLSIVSSKFCLPELPVTRVMLATDGSPLAELTEQFALDLERY